MLSHRQVRQHLPAFARHLELYLLGSALCICLFLLYLAYEDAKISLFGFWAFPRIKLVIAAILVGIFNLVEASNTGKA